VEEPYGLRLVPDERSETAFSLKGAAQTEEVKGSSADLLEVLVVDLTFGTEELSGYSKYINQVESTPQIIMHRKDASRLGLSHEDKVALHLPEGTLTAELRAVENMAEGVVVMPRHRQWNWQKLKALPLMIAGDNIERL
jgi:NADH-quinone oxidoreductase subunit G